MKKDIWNFDFLNDDEIFFIHDLIKFEIKQNFFLIILLTNSKVNLIYLVYNRLRLLMWDIQYDFGVNL